MDSLELLLDDDAEADLREDWERLIDAGLPSSGRHAGASNRPHITLVAAPSLAPRTLPDLDERVAAAVAGMGEILDQALETAGLLIFGPPRGTYVLCRQIIPTRELLELQRLVHESVQPVPGQSPQTFPDLWTPHLTLGRKLTGHQLARALPVLPRRQVRGRAAGLRRWDSTARTVRLLAPVLEADPAAVPGAG